MSVFPDLSRYDRFAVDTETTGNTRAARPVGCSIWTPDGRGFYLRWGHDPERLYRGDGGNNCTLAEFTAWARVEFMRPGQVKVFFNAPFDLRMFAYAGVIPFPGLIPNVEDAGTSAALLDENEPSYALDRLCEKHLGRRKEDEYLNEWCAAQFGGKPWRSVQAGNYWRAPGDLVEEYAIGDAELTLGLHDRNLPLLRAQGLESVYRLETAIIPIAVNMHLAGVRIDKTRAEEVSRGLRAELGVEKARWMDTAAGAGFPMPAIDDWTLPSTQQSAPVFRALGVPAVGKTEVRLNAKGKTTGGNDSVTKELLEAAEENHESARILLRVRELEKMDGTFIQSYILDQADGDDLVHGEFHPLPVEYKPGKKYGTITGRFSSWLHNVPGDRHPAAGRLVRSLFVPWSDDHVWVKADYSQIEYRFLGHYAGGGIAAAYNTPPPPGTCPACGKDHSITGVDFHCMLTLLINNPNCNRRRTKNVNFAKVYGAGLAKAAATAGISVAEWKEVLDVYDAKVPEVSQIYKAADKRGNQRGYIVTWGGRRVRFKTASEARKMGWKVRSEEMHVGTFRGLNYLLQGSAADLIKKAMVRIAGPGGIIDWSNTFLHLQVHDELDSSAPRGAAGEKFVTAQRELMESWTEADGPRFNVPIRADIKAGASWGALIKDE